MSDVTSKNRKHERFTILLHDGLIVGITLLAPAIGGSAELWVQALLMACCALLVLWRPPQRVLAWPLTLASLGLIVLAFLTFLPRHWLGQLAWLQTFEQQCQVTLPPTVTPQPWMTLKRALMFTAGVFWINFLICRRWQAHRTTLAPAYSTGIIILALAVFAYYFADYLPHFSYPQSGFGFFRNRNQTGNLFALGGIMCVVLAFTAALRKKKAGVFWVAGALVIGAVLAVNRSRAGIGLFFIGTVIWLVWVSIALRLRGRLALGASGILVLLSLFFLFGGEALNRFFQMRQNGASDARWTLHRACLPLLKDASWKGIGLGNFAAVFPGYRQDNMLSLRAAHPESDWLWLAIEMGFLAPLLVWFFLGYLICRAWPKLRDGDREGTASDRREVSVEISQRLSRRSPDTGPTDEEAKFVDSNFLICSGSVVCVLMFALHGFVDVSGHSVGAIMPALLLLSIGTRSGSIVREQVSVQRFYRGMAVLFLGVAGLWLVSVFGTRPLPTPAVVERLRNSVTGALDSKDFELVIPAADQALQWAPLDWQLYLTRGIAKARVAASTALAQADFARSFYLEPNSPVPPWEAGKNWLGIDEDLAIDTWKVALRRTAPDGQDSLFRQMLDLSREMPEMSEKLWKLTDANPGRELILLSMTETNLFALHLDRLLQSDPSLKSYALAQKEHLFSLWWQKGDHAQLVGQLKARPEWLAAGWQLAGEEAAQQGEFQAACELAGKFSPRPEIPDIQIVKSVPELARDLLANPKDPFAGLALYRSQMKEGRIDEALITVRKLTESGQCPSYFHFLEAQLCEQKGAWKAAWSAWQRFAQG